MHDECQRMVCKSIQSRFSVGYRVGKAYLPARETLGAVTYTHVVVLSELTPLVYVQFFVALA